MLRKVILFLSFVVITLGCYRVTGGSRSTLFFPTDAKIIVDIMSASLLSEEEIFQKKAPKIILGRIENNTTQYIDTDIIGQIIAVKLIKSNSVDFVNRDLRTLEEIRNELILIGALGDTTDAPKIGKFKGGHFILTGDIGEVVLEDGKIRSYTIVLILTNIETSIGVWGHHINITKIRN